MNSKTVKTFDTLTLFMVLLHAIGLAFMLLVSLGSGTSEIDIESLFANPFAMMAIVNGASIFHWSIGSLILKIYCYMKYMVLVIYNGYEAIRKLKNICTKNTQPDRKGVPLICNIFYVAITIIEFWASLRWMWTIM